jgi:hypothetical protein
VVLAAFAAVVWVAYQQGVKEGQRSNPPILSAESGPTRVAPETQQTAEASPADKSMERLSGDSATSGEEQIMPAPEEPRPLPSPQEVTSVAPPPSAQSMIAPPAPAQQAIAPSPARPDTDHPGLDTTVSSIAPPAQPSSAQRVIGSQATHVAPPSASSEDLTAALPPAEDSVLAATPATPAAAPAKPAKPKPTTTASAVPALPSSSVTGHTALTGEGGPLVAPKPIETAQLETPTGTSAAPPVAAGGPIAIQLGSFPTDALAAASWSKIKSGNVAVLGDYSPKFQRAEVEGKGTWYRLQVTGFADKAAAQDVCNKLKANGQACIITTAK